MCNCELFIYHHLGKAQPYDLKLSQRMYIYATSVCCPELTRLVARENFTYPYLVHSVSLSSSPNLVPCPINQPEWAMQYDQCSSQTNMVYRATTTYPIRTFHDQIVNTEVALDQIDTPASHLQHTLKDWSISEVKKEAVLYILKGPGIK